jgi:hypothetical protein
VLNALAAGGSYYCGSHPNAGGNCSSNGLTSEVFAILVVAAIVALALFDLVWKLRFGTKGPVARLINAVIAAVTRGSRSK